MKNIPIFAAKIIAETYDYDQVIIIARKTGEGGGEHVTTYGKNKTHCDIAAKIGDFLKYKVMGWTEEKLSKTSNGTNYIADHESRPKQFKFENGRRVWITNEGYLDTDFGILQPYSESLVISDKLKNTLESAPVHRLGETESDFIERYKEWYRTTRRESLNL